MVTRLISVVDLGFACEQHSLQPALPLVSLPLLVSSNEEAGPVPVDCRPLTSAASEFRPTAAAAKRVPCLPTGEEDEWLRLDHLDLEKLLDLTVFLAAISF